jgi:CBS domain-containing protein
MDSLIRRPEEILAYRSLRRILESKPKALWTVGPDDSVRTALQLMADKDIGFLVVTKGDEVVGVLSERDCARRVVLENKDAAAVLVSDIMVRQVVAADPTHTFADCLRLMHQRAVRHLPVLDYGKVVAVVSIRDLLAEAVAHHAKIIAGLERERLEIFTPTT